MLYVFKNFLFYPQAGIRQTKHMEMMIKRSEVVNFMSPGTGVFVLGRGFIWFIVKMHLYCFETFFSTLGRASGKLNMK